eukprot:12776063-Alexandrium_andersonii.AAC.1
MRGEPPPELLRGRAPEPVPPPPDLHVTPPRGGPPPHRGVEDAPTPLLEVASYHPGKSPDAVCAVRALKTDGCQPPWSLRGA